MKTYAIQHGIKKCFFLWMPFILSLPFLLSAEWIRVGLAGKEVTAMARKKIWNDTIFFAGTHEGVWHKSGSDTGFTLLQSVSMTEPYVFPLNIHALYCVPNRLQLWAADDSGLAVYTFTSGLPPLWKRCAEIPSVPVTDIICSGDTLFCCTRLDVYRSFDNGVTWDACSTRSFLPPLGNITSFTSLALFCGINAGSEFLGALNSWEGVMNSADYGKKWDDISNLPGQEKPLGQVFDLISFVPQFSEPQRLLAATGTGLLFFLGDKDTGVWHSFKPDIEQAIPNNVNVSYFSRSLIADIWVATDSGAYSFSYRSTVPSWVRLSSQKTLCLIPICKNDPDRWYAGTDDGIWEYAETAPVIAKKKRIRAEHTCADTRMYTINGRLLKKSPRGCGVTLQQETRGKTETIRTRILRFERSNENRK